MWRKEARGPRGVAALAEIVEALHPRRALAHGRSCTPCAPGRKASSGPAGWPWPSPIFDADLDEGWDKGAQARTLAGDEALEDRFGQTSPAAAREERVRPSAPSCCGAAMRTS